MNSLLKGNLSGDYTVPTHCGFNSCFQIIGAEHFIHLFLSCSLIIFHGMFETESLVETDEVEVYIPVSFYDFK